MTLVWSFYSTAQGALLIRETMNQMKLNQIKFLFLERGYKQPEGTEENLSEQSREQTNLKSE